MTEKRKVKYKLDQVFLTVKGKESITLRSLHSEYSARLRHSGALIWQIGSVFIPLSLSGIVLGLDNPLHTLAVAVFSVFLIWTWYFISVVLDIALERDLAICATIETALLKPKRKMTRRGLNELIQQTGGWGIRLRTLRLIIPIVVITLGWVGVSLLSFLAPI